MKFIVYVAVLLVTAAGLAFGLDYITKPAQLAKLPAEPAIHAARNTAPEPIRQIPIGRVNPGDPNGELSPIYPANPGKDLPVKDLAVKDTPVTAAKAAGTTARPETSGSAPANVSPPAALQTQAPNACNIAACTAAYNSFRAADCSYQPYDGPRKTCDLTGDAQDRIVSQQQPHGHADRASARGDDDELRDVERTVRRLPERPYNNRDRRGIVVIEQPDGSRYSLRRNWIDDQ